MAFDGPTAAGHRYCTLARTRACERRPVAYFSYTPAGAYEGGDHSIHPGGIKGFGHRRSAAWAYADCTFTIIPSSEPVIGEPLEDWRRRLLHGARQ